jgi:hypothetical protein
LTTKGKTPKQRWCQYLIAFEIAFLMFLGAVLIVAIAAGGRPLAEAYSEKMKFQYRELGSHAENILNKKCSVLQQEIADLKDRLHYLEMRQDAQDKGIGVNKSALSQHSKTE